MCFFWFLSDLECFQVEGGNDAHKYTKSQELCSTFPPHLHDNHDTRIGVSTLTKRAEGLRSLTKVVNSQFRLKAHALPQEEELSHLTLQSILSFHSLFGPERLVPV